MACWWLWMACGWPVDDLLMAVYCRCYSNEHWTEAITIYDELLHSPDYRDMVLLRYDCDMITI